MRRTVLCAALALGCGEAEPPAAAAGTDNAPAATKPARTDDGPPPDPAAADPKAVDLETEEPWLRVASYNILAAKRGMEGIVKTLVELKADVVALQEVDRLTRRFGKIDQVVELADSLGYQHAFARHRRYQGGEIGVALLSRFPISEARRIGTRGSQLGMLLATLATDRGPLRVLVVHFHPTDPRQSQRERNRMNRIRAREAAQALKTAVAQTQPTIVLGDFNARPSGPEYATFADAFRDACKGAPATWPTPIPLVTLDYIWLSAELEPIGCPVIPSTASDHRPVVTDLRHAASAQPQLPPPGS